MMKGFVKARVWPLVLIGSFLMTGCVNNTSEKLTIATAANMQFAMTELIDAFEKEKGISCEFIVASSGKLTSQIQEGAPYDLFISADMKYPTALYDKELTDSSPRIFAYGNLVLWTINEKLEPSIESLSLEEIDHIGMANPKTAPYGQAAVEVLNYHNLTERLEDKLVYGESISQTNQFIISKAADIGFTAKSVVLSPQMKGKGQWVSISSTLHSPIAQGVVVLKNRKSQIENARQFQDFLLSERGKEILVKFGYSIED